MDLMMRLKGGQAFKAVSDEFKSREESLGGDGLPIDEFVEIMLKGLPKARSIQEKYDTISGLIDLFNDIDINGDGTLEFNEFTSYCVDAGMVATRVKTAPLKYQYMKNNEYVDRTTQGNGIEKIKWCPELKKVLVIETKSNNVRVYTPDLKTVENVYSTSVSLPSQVGFTEHDNFHHRSAYVANDFDLLVQDAEFIPDHRFLAIATSNFTITFYDTDHYTYAMESQASVTQKILKWCHGAGYLISSGNNHVVYVWQVLPEKVSLLKTLTEHQDMVMDVLSIPQYDLILTCDIKHYIYLWDIQDCRHRGSIVGHTYGVRQMVFSAMNDLLLTAGFEYDAFGWDVSSKQIVMKLSGHRAPLVGIQLARFHTERAVTADIEGLFKVWNIHRLNGMNAQIIETISAAAQFCPRTFVTLTPKRDIIAGSCLLHMFESIKIQKHDEIPIQAFYHQGNNVFLGMTESCVNMWDGLTGVMAEEFTGLTQSLFLVCCQDDLNRKIIGATEDGQVEVFNSVNLARVKKSTGNIGRIGGLHYDSKNKLIIATTFPSIHTRENGATYENYGSGGIYIFDDMTIGECVLLRSLTNINIGCSAFSTAASLIASVSPAESIKLWDFETLQLQATCFTNQVEFSLLEFLGPYPALFAADNCGNVMLFAVPPQLSNYSGGLLTMFSNTAPLEEASEEDKKIGHTESKYVVTTMSYAFHTELDQHILIAGDEKGMISIWNLNPIFEGLMLKLIPEEKLKSKRRGYNARCKFKRDYGEERNARSRLMKKDWIEDRSQSDIENKRPEKKLPKETSKAITSEMILPIRMYMWHAHTDTIHSIQVNEMPNILLSCSFDGMIHIWDWKGNQLGCLSTNESIVIHAPWKFQCENTSRQQKRHEIVQEIIEKIEISPREREKFKARRNKSNIKTETMNPLLSQLVENNCQIKQKTQEKLKNRKRPDIHSALESARQLSLIQVGPLIVSRMKDSSEMTSGEESIDSTDSLSMDVLDSRNLSLAKKTSEEIMADRLQVQKNQENLVKKTNVMYMNYMGVQTERQKKISIVQNSKNKDIDINPSQFLRDKLGVQDILSTDHLIYGSRPNTAPPISHVKLLPCLSKNEIHSKKNNKKKISLNKIKKENNKILTNNNISTGSLKKINDIITSASCSNLPGMDIELKLDKNELFNENQKKHLLKQIYKTQKRYDTAITSTDYIIHQKINQHEKQKEIENKKRSKRYLNQKKRQINLKIGNILRHTSILMTSKTNLNELNGIKKKSITQRFGIYSIKEVMVIIRLFWSLDIDHSGTISENELMGCHEYFKQLGYTDMSSIFQSIDRNGSGQVHLSELLKICFIYATSNDIHDMLLLEKIGRAPEIFSINKELNNEEILDLKNIFNVFDKDKNGTVSFDELLDVLQYNKNNIYEKSPLTRNEIKKMYYDEDCDGNKQLDFNEFIHFLQGIYTPSKCIWVDR